MKTKITVAIIGVIAIFAVMLRKSLIGGFAATAVGDGRGSHRLRHVGHVDSRPDSLNAVARSAQSD